MLIPDLPAIRVLKDTHPETQRVVINILRDMQANRYSKNEALEKYKKEREAKKASNPEHAQDKKRSRPDKSVQIPDLTGEITMFQEEHLKLQNQVALQQRLIGNLHKRVKQLESTLASHLEMGGPPAPSVEDITSAILLTSNSVESISECSTTPVPSQKDEECSQICLACNKKQSICKCFDD
jgi:hypothetical protein